MATKVAKDRVGDLLVTQGLITEAQLTEALTESRNEGTRVGYQLVRLGHIKELDLTRVLAQKYRVPAVDLNKLEIDEKVIRLLTPEVAHKHQVIPLRKVGRRLTVRCSIRPTTVRSTT